MMRPFFFHINYLFPHKLSTAQSKDYTHLPLEVSYLRFVQVPQGFLHPKGDLQIDAGK
jgi:hypothetical protein